MNIVHNVFLLTICASASGVLALGSAAVAAEIVSEVAPPPLRIERAPAPRDGYVWGPGHWELNGHSYTWVSGTWIAERRGARWIADHWDQAGSQWRYVPGHWER